MIVGISFFVLLCLGIPISIVVLISSIFGLLVYSDVSLLIVVQQMFNGLNNFVLLAIPFFIMAGNIAARGNIAKYLIEVMKIIFGKITGGNIIASISACAFFAAISGSSMATIVAVGSIMMPALIKMGYPKNMTTGSITAAGSVGMLIPPSAPMIMICVAMGTSVGEQFMAGFIPGVLLTIVWCVFIFFNCRNLELEEQKQYTKKEKKELWIKSIFSLLYPVIVLGGIYAGFATPTEAAAIALVYVIIVEMFIYKTIGLKDVEDAAYNALITSGAIIFIIACASVLNWLITTQQIPVIMAGMIEANISSKVVFILLITVVFLIFGCFMDLIALIVILGPILKPTLAYFNINLIHFGIMAVMNSQIAFLTPPLGLNLYVTMSLTDQSLFEITKAVLPYLILLIIVTLIVSFIPEISLFLPNLLR